MNNKSSWFKYTTLCIILTLSSCSTNPTPTTPSPSNSTVTIPGPTSIPTPVVATATLRPAILTPSAQPSPTVPVKFSTIIPAQSPTTSPTNTPTPQTGLTRTDYAEGACSQDIECTWAAQGCGGGHGICTNSPKKYKDMLSTCEINDDFPSNQGFSCGCITSQGKCGWKI